MSCAVVIGQSHSAALAHALLTERKDVSGISVYRLEDRKRPYERDVITLDNAVSLVRRLPAETRVFLSTLGTYHNIWGLLRSGPAFDFLLDPADAPDLNAEIRIPHRAIASAFELKSCEALAGAKNPGSRQVSCLSLERAPAEAEQRFHAGTFHGAEEAILSRHKRQRCRSGASRNSRLKLWLMETRATARWAASEDLNFVPAPAEAFDENGFLHPQFYSDATHANAGYGALVIDQISAIAEEALEAPARG